MRKYFCVITFDLWLYIDPDEAPPSEPSRLELHCLQRYLYVSWSAGLKMLWFDLDEVYLDKYPS